MAQHDYDIANASAATIRTDLNNVLDAIVSLNSGDSAPSTTFGNMLWYETDTDTLHMRNEANTGWIELARLDQTNSRWTLTSAGVRAASASEWQILDNAGAKIIGIAKGGGITEGTGKAFWATETSAKAGLLETGVMNEKRTSQAIDAQTNSAPHVYLTRTSSSAVNLSSAWKTVGMENEAVDDLSVSISSGGITLAAGTYWIVGGSYFYNNSTSNAGVVELAIELGSTHYGNTRIYLPDRVSGNTTDVPMWGEVRHKATLASSTTLKLEAKEISGNLYTKNTNNNVSAYLMVWKTK